MSSQISLFDPLIVDNFAGGGGASTGIEMATGRPVSRKDQVARCGNAVCHPLAAAVVRANCPELCPGEIDTMKGLMKEMTA